MSFQFSISGLRKLCLSLGMLMLCMSSQAQVTFYDLDSIQEIRITFEQANWRHVLDSMFQNYGEDARLAATVQVNGETFQQSGIRYKGFSSYSEDQAKNPFNIDLDFGFADHNYQGFTKLKLSNVIHDPSFIREVLSYEVARNYMPASRANFANVYVNDTLLGLYTNVEAVDKKFISKNFPSNQNTFFKGSPATLQYPFGQNSNLAYTHGDDSTGYVPFYQLESALGWSDVFHFIDVLNNDTSHIPDVLNVDRALWMHAFNYALVNLDSYIAYSQNYYMYKDDNGCFNAIPWDLNMSFGSFRFSDGTSLNLSIAKAEQLNPLQHLYNSAYSPRPLMKNLFANTTFRKMYIAHLRTIIDEQFKTGIYMVRGQEIQNTIAQAVANDTNKFYSTADFLNNLTTTTGPSSDQNPGIQELMEARMAYLDSFPGFRGAPELSLQSFSPARPEQNESCLVECKVVSASHVYVYYRFSSNGLFMRQTMLDDGTNGDVQAGDSVYSASIIVSGDILHYYFYAENDSAGRFLPERAQYEFFTIYPKIQKNQVVLNELMLFNTTIVDQNGGYDPWLELYNTTDESLNLGGLQMYSEESPTISILTFPDTILPANEYIVIWLDGESAQPGLHASQRIDNSSWIRLSNTDLSDVDSLTFGLQSAGRSFGSWPNGSGINRYLRPTYVSCNQVATSNTYDFSAFPNPSNDHLYIEALDGQDVTSIELYNSNLQRVHYEESPFGTSPTKAALNDIDVSSMNAGLYVVKINRETQTDIIKVIISR